MMNTPRVCMQETKKAFRKLSKDDMLGAVQALCNLKGVGPAMASAVLAAGAPHLAPFMADECLWAMPDVDSLDYTIKEYMNYIEHINACVNRINENGAADWTPHKVELAVWTYYILHDLKPELLQDLPSSSNSISASVRVENQTIESRNNDKYNTETTPAAKETAVFSSPMESSSEVTNPPLIPENHLEADPGTGISPRNGQEANKLSNIHSITDNGGTIGSSNTESNDAKAEDKFGKGYVSEYQPEPDLNREMFAATQNITPIMTNGRDTVSELSALSSSHMVQDVQLSSESPVLQATNGTHGIEAKIDETSNYRLQSDDASFATVPTNGNSNNGSIEVQQSEEKQVAAVTSNSVGEDWVMVEKEECPTIESLDKIPPAPIKRLHENTDQGNNVITSDDAIPLQKKLRTDESNCEQSTIDAIKKQQQEQMTDTGASPKKVDNGSSLVV